MRGLRCSGLLAEECVAEEWPTLHPHVQLPGTPTSIPLPTIPLPRKHLVLLRQSPLPGAHGSADTSGFTSLALPPHVGSYPVTPADQVAFFMDASRARQLLAVVTHEPPR